MAASGSTGLKKAFFGEFELHLQTGELHRNGDPVKLQRQPGRILGLLVSRAGQVVTREDIIREIWGEETFVNYEQGLNYAVRQVRTALADDAERPQYIETIPKLGYRFIARVTQAAPPGNLESPKELAQSRQTGPGKTWRHWSIAAVLFGVALAILLIQKGGIPSTPKSGKIMVAVLPFQNLSGDPEQDYFSDGMTEELVAQLGRLEPQKLGVIARTSVMAYKKTSKAADQIGRELGVAYIVEGSVRREAGRVRITAQLIQLRDQTHLWADSYDSDGKDLLSLEDEVARAITRAISSDLLPQLVVRSRPADPAAYEDFLRAKYFWNKGTTAGYQSAIQFFRQAIAKDPNYAAAHAGLAATYNLMGYWLIAPPREVFPSAKEEALRALELDPSLPEAHAALAYEKMEYDWDFAGAGSEFERALALDPNSASTHQWYGVYLGVTGQLPAAERELSIAHTLDPLSLHVNMIIASKSYLLRRYDKAIAELQDIVAMDSSFDPAYSLLGAAYRERGKQDEAAAAFIKAWETGGAAPEIVAELRQAYSRAGLRGYWHKEAELLIAQSKRSYVPAVQIAMDYACLHDANAAFLWLQKAYDERSGWLLELNLDPVWDPIRADPRFEELLGRVGIKGYAGQQK